MPAPGSKKHDDGSVNASTALEQAISGLSSNLWGAIRATEDTGGLVHLSLKRDPDGGWFAVAKRLSPEDGEPQVLFADGDSFVGTLANMGRAISKGKWKVDKPWRGGS